MKKLNVPGLRFSFREEFPCPYLGAGRIAAVEYILPVEGIAAHFDEYLSEGYRRLGTVLYRNVCPECSSCLPIRIETEKFRVSRSQKRVIKKNLAVRVESRSPSVTPEKIALYKKYIASKHPGEEEKDTRDYFATLSSLHYGFSGSIEMDYFLGERLICVGIVDAGAHSLSSVYCYYDTDYLAGRIGIFSIVREIGLARSLSKKYYYLGFYVAETPKMSYKKFFRPNQICDNGEWRDFIIK